MAAKQVQARQQAGAEVFDAANAVAGRLASFVVKQLLQGKAVVVVNADKAIITGNPKNIVARYHAKRQIQNKANPENSPKWPRRPDLLYKKMISGMLPKKPRGNAAYKRLKIFVGVPQEFAGKQLRQFGVKQPTTRFTTLAELCKQLGWQVG